MRTVTLPGGETVPALGQGTWMMAEDASRRRDEIAALRAGIEAGLTLIDTAEMYADGACEELVGEAIRDVRSRVFLVGKAYPQNASRRALPRACEASLRRLGTDKIDLYLLHWRGGVPLAETVDAMKSLVQAGKIRHWGVSNLDLDDMQELVEEGGDGCATNQILYNLTRRGPEFDLLPWLAGRAIPVMAYSPVEQGRLIGHPVLARIAKERGLTAAQVALAWVLRREGTIAIPKAGRVAHVLENGRAADIVLSAEELTALDQAFPPPTKEQSLAMI